MTNETTLLVENKNNFSAIGVVNYEFYKDEKSLIETLKKKQRNSMYGWTRFYSFW
jgi:hypothetical protein